MKAAATEIVTSVLACTIIALIVYVAVALLLTLAALGVPPHLGYFLRLFIGIGLLCGLYDGVRRVVLGIEDDRPC